MLAGVPVVAAIAALVSLRRVQISPLGVVRRATPRPPSFWRLIALAAGAGVYVYGLGKTSRNTPGRSATSSSAGSSCQRRQASTSSAGSAPSPVPRSTRCTTC
jgi:hypothetical protein